MSKKKRTPYTKRALQKTINQRDQQIKDMKKAGQINITANFRAKLRLKTEIQELKQTICNLEKELEGYKKDV